MATSELEKILEPCRSEDFFASAWGETYRHVKGWPGKFKQLMPWNKLNEILRQHRLDYPRMRLMRDGERLPASSYIRYAHHARTKTAVPRLRPAELTKHLREGATIVLDAVNELCDPIGELAEGLEFIFHERVQVNMYAGWRESRGFDLHWDDHDVFILQVAGRKLWRIYGQTKKYPETGDDAPRPEDIDHPLWEGHLEDGDLLYIPRGWWHVAFPLAEPTLHLTVGIHNRTGTDLLRWFAGNLRERESFRQNLPRFSSSEERRAHLERLREEILSAWSDELLDEFLDEQDAAAMPRTRLSFPWSATGGILPPKDARLRFLAPRPVRFKVEAGVLEFACLSKRWRFREEASCLLRPLAERRICSVSELCEAARGTLDERTVRKFLGELVLEGLVAVVED